MNKGVFPGSLFAVAFMAALLFCVPPSHAKKETVQRLISRNWFNEGYGFYMAKKYQPAIEAYSKAIEVDPKYAAAYCGRAVAYADLGDYRRAIEDCGKAIKIKPKFAAAYYYRGKFYAILDDKKQATEDFKIAARLGEKEARKILKAEGIPWQGKDDVRK